MQPVQSSWIAAIGWEGERGKPGRCYMQTRDGGVYLFHGVPNTFYQLWLASASKGQFWHRSVSGRYPETVVRKVISVNRPGKPGGKVLS